MFTTRYRLAVLVVLLTTGGCRPDAGPIQIAENVVTVENRTSGEWRKVVVTVNDHFHGGAAVLAAHGRLSAPLSQFQTAFGQRFDIARQNVFKVEVTATDSAGGPVRLEYGGAVKKP